MPRRRKLRDDPEANLTRRAKPHISAIIGGFAYKCACHCCMRLGFGMTPEKAYRDLFLSHMLPDIRAERMRV
jgi:hypothetical protein